MKKLFLPPEVEAELNLMAGRVWGLSQVLEIKPLDLLDFIGRVIANNRQDPNQLTLVPVAEVGKDEDHFHFEHLADGDPDPGDSDRHLCGSHLLPQEATK